MYIIFSSTFESFFLNDLAGVISLDCSRPEYSWKIARWTLNNNQSINQSWLFNWKLKVCLCAKKNSYKIFKSFKRSYIDRNILYYNKNKIQIQMFVLFPNIFETKQYVAYLSNMLCNFESESSLHFGCFAILVEWNW